MNTKYFIENLPILHCKMEAREEASCVDMLRGISSDLAKLIFNLETLSKSYKAHLILSII
jgi:hypothetical protein